MSPIFRTALRAAVIVAGAAVTLAGVLAFRAADWPIYLAFVLVSFAVVLPGVEVLPKMSLSIPQLAATIAFLYIGGLPIVVLRNLSPAFLLLLDRTLPQRWTRHVPGFEAAARGARGELLGDIWGTGSPAESSSPADLAMFALGLGSRWAVAAALAPDGRPALHPEAIAVGELAGYACWTALAVLPIFAYQPVLPPPPDQRLRSVLKDIGLVIVFVLTPFVFLITYGWATAGLMGAVAWSLASLGLHVMLARLNERRLTVEEQNRRLAALNRELEHRERLSAIGKMSSVVSHQILHQLGVIGIYADLIRHAGVDEPPAAGLTRARTNAGAIEGALAGVNRVLTDLLVFSRDLRLNLYAHPLDRVLAESLDDCRPEATARHVVLALDCPPGVEATLDKLKVKQALGNLVRNAIEVSPAGGTVTVRGAVHDGVADLTVSDQGPGVPERDREAVFAPFFTTKEHGTGLGLAIAREFAEAHGGQLSVEAAADGGAAFVLRLPLAGPRPTA